MEEHRPNQAAEAGAVRSQQTVETTGPGAAGATPPAGVPGATSNQPPGASSAPVNGPAAALAPTGAAAGAAGAAAQRPPGKRESTINYEVDKTVKTVRSATGQIRRLSAAVVVNYQGVADAAGKVVPTALSAQQVEQMTALVRESIGFNKERGDSVNLMNTPFLVDAPVQVELPLWKRPEILELARSFAWPVGLVLIGAIVLLGMVRPGLKAMAAAKPLPGSITPALGGPAAGSQLNAMVADTPERPALGAPEAVAVPSPQEQVPEQMRLEGARQMARQNPVAVANIVKTWVHG